MPARRLCASDAARVANDRPDEDAARALTQRPGARHPGVAPRALCAGIRRGRLLRVAARAGAFAGGAFGASAIAQADKIVARAWPTDHPFPRKRHDRPLLVAQAAHRRRRHDRPRYRRPAVPAASGASDAGRRRRVRRRHAARHHHHPRDGRARGDELRRASHARDPARPQIWRADVLMASSVFMLLALHLLETVVWAASLVYGGLVPSWRAAGFFAGNTYTTVGYGNFVLPPGWEMLAPIIAMSGLFAFGWSGSVLVDIVARCQRIKDVVARARAKSIALPARATFTTMRHLSQGRNAMADTQRPGRTQGRHVGHRVGRTPDRDRRRRDHAAGRRRARLRAPARMAPRLRGHRRDRLCDPGARQGRIQRSRSSRRSSRSCWASSCCAPGHRHRVDRAADRRVPARARRVRA